MSLILRWLARQVPYCEARVKETEGRLRAAVAQRNRCGQAEKILRLEKQLMRRERRLGKARAAQDAITLRA